ncbi:TadE/TadG family type IV pilus assembly protein [Marimonas arenosa]|uniref:Pilus assembly protein TadG-related protein n=1 Tax=Marimonas arenosa TaxID=1795305 RepID=A0AAE3WC33_9RHOB|nr:TadE/TadG family type IV pilus assembly protein [Marimonas arenosa]MDQ2089685.1 pilus assembly protein TadG-related protein [Marimonas arenosa]
MRQPQAISRFIRSEDGGVLAFWGVCLAALLGMVALSFDFGRIAVTQTELQAFADNVALATAGELDGTADALDRATLAAAQLISDYQTYGNGDNVLSGATDYTLTFLASLPESDTDIAADVTADPVDAAYVQVSVSAQTVDLTFAAAFSALTGQDPMENVVSATAVAGFVSYACDVTPMMFCMPSPSWTADANIGQMIQLRAGGQGAAWTPGAFGFLDPSKVLVDTEGPCEGLNGGNLDRCLMGAAGPITQCFSYRGVDIEPGQKTGSLEAAINTRFDIYNSTMNGERNDADYAPAPNVIKGIVPAGGGSCIGNNEALSPNTVGLPRDTCFGDGVTPNTCNSVNGGVGTRFGDGNWDRSGYFGTNYAPFDGTVPASIQGWLTTNAANAAQPTRYEVYRAEIATAGDILTGDIDGNGNDGNPIAESGRPICNTRSNPDIDYSRRVIVAAGINCGAPNNISGAATNVPVEEYVKIFLTEPASNDGTGNSFTIWGEVAGTAGGDGDGVSEDAGLFRDLVQLYR